MLSVDYRALLLYNELCIAKACIYPTVISAGIRPRSVLKSFWGWPHLSLNFRNIPLISFWLSK